MSDKTPFNVLSKGAPVLSHGYGYMVERGERVAAFFVDLDSKYCEVAMMGSGNDDAPSIYIGAQEHSLYLAEGDREALTAIEFPEFKGWHVHSAQISKHTMAVCLTDFHGGLKAREDQP